MVVGEIIERVGREEGMGDKEEWLFIFFFKLIEVILV